MIYHYTDLNAAKLISENAEVWLTDYRFLNDKEEFLKGYEVLMDAVHAYQDNECKYPKEFIRDIESAVAFILEDSFQALERNNIFVASFSRSPDSLSQWRSYGMYCLELDEDFFRDDNVEVLECHYLQNLGDALDYANDLISDNIFPEVFKVWQRDKSLVSVELISLIDIYALSFKHEAFYDENEIRFVISCSSDDCRITFRAKGDMLIPFISLKFDPQLLKSIRVGPVDNQGLACESMNMFAYQVSQKIQQEFGNVEYCLFVESSDIPYRNI